MTEFKRDFDTVMRTVTRRGGHLLVFEGSWGSLKSVIAKHESEHV